jgi:hypothetical protein
VIRRLLLLIPLLLSLAGTAAAERDRLYSDPDPASPGGIKGRILRPALTVRQVLAVPTDEPRLVYEAQLSGEGQREFLFTGLPMRKYDLVVIYDDAFYEGLVLCREGETLTAEDRTKIEATIQKAEPYFTKRITHRMEGTTGRGNLSRALCTFLRDRASTNGEDYRRTFRLFILKDVGPGWQVVRSRDLYPIWTTPNHATPAHHFDEKLSQIRVTDSVKDLGPITLLGQ